MEQIPVGDISTMDCDRCGEQCVAGGEIRSRQRDRVTGYQDEEIICRACLLLETCSRCGSADLHGSRFTPKEIVCQECRREEGRYEAADADYDAMVEGSL